MCAEVSARLRSSPSEPSVPACMSERAGVRVRGSTPEFPSPRPPILPSLLSFWEFAGAGTSWIWPADPEARRGRVVLVLSYPPQRPEGRHAATVWARFPTFDIQLLGGQSWDV